MTAAASFGDVASVDSRLGIARRKDRRQVVIPGVAIDTTRRLHSTLNAARVKAAVVSCMRICVKLGPAEVRQSFTRSVTALAVEFWI